MMKMLEELRCICTEENLLRPQERVVVAVSGGPDSMALFHLLHRLASEWDLSLIAAHVDHRFRGEQAKADARLVTRFAEQLGWPVEATAIDLPAHIEQTGENAQAAARDKRYAYLYELAGKHHADCIALGHHADDQAETVLMRIIQGTSTSGLAGMPLARTARGFRLIRPLLAWNKEQLLQYCHTHNIPYALDASNLQPIYVRNRMRLELFPLLRTYNPQLSEALVRLAKTAEADNAYMEQQAQRQFSSIVERNGDCCRFSRNSFCPLPLALQRRVITLILRYLSSGKRSADFDKVEKVREAICRSTPPSSTLDLGDMIRFVREYDQVRMERVRPAAEAGSPYCYRLDRAPFRLEVAEADVVLQAHVLEADADADYELPRNAYQLWLDLDQVLFPLYVRNRKHGDRMQVAGLNGSKKVKNIFIDDKLPPSLRRRIPIMTDRRGKILWIPGVRRSKLAFVRPSTRHILHIICTPFIT